jgi:MFS family permease
LDDSFNAYTIPVQYKYHQCEGSDVVNIIYGFIYFGFIIGVFIRAFIVDSYGRRPLMIVFNGSIVLGSILAVSSINIWITGIGFFLVNCGSDGATKMSLNYLTEYYDP